MVVSSLRDFDGDGILFPAINRWATFFRPSGTSSYIRISNPYLPVAKRLFILNPGVQESINQVDDEIDPHHPGGEKQVDSLDRRVVSALDCIQV